MVSSNVFGSDFVGISQQTGVPSQKEGKIWDKPRTDTSKSLTLEKLWLKALTLFTLTAMLQPLDIAPRSSLVFRHSALSSDQEGGLVIYIHGTKNDADRDGFRITLRPSSDPDICPVTTLLAYLTRTAVQAQGCGGPVFVSLQPPYTAITATTVANVLNQSIALAGLDRHIYSAKNFRPTGATTTVQQGVEPQQVQALGHWKQSDTFLKHYVYSALHVSVMDNILGISGNSQIWSWLAETGFYPNDRFASQRNVGHRDGVTVPVTLVYASKIEKCRKSYLSEISSVGIRRLYRSFTGIDCKWDVPGLTK